MGGGRGDGHAGVFEGGGRVHSLVLGLKRVEAGYAGAAGQIVEWRVPLA